MAEIESLKKLVAGFPTRPGIYRMLNAKREIIYVGKARNLRKRTTSYFTKAHGSRIQQMVMNIENVEFIVTDTEAQALLLESNLIKKHKPRYNIVLRDDKSYPYIYMSTDKEYPAIRFHRGARKGKGDYFGPYPSAGAVRRSLQLLQKVFKVRQCDESYFKNRRRPCLQFQIKRCTGPCTGEISQVDYEHDVNDSMEFLRGNSDKLVEKRIALMDEAAANQEYESAAAFRDQIQMLRRITEQQYISGKQGSADVIVVLVEGGIACVVVFYIRHGSSLGNRYFYPRLPDKKRSANEIIAAFIQQYYSNREIPAEIITNERPEDARPLTAMLELQREGKVQLKQQVRGQRKKWLEMAKKNAVIQLQSKLTSQASQRKRLQNLQQSLKLENPPSRMECFDISHSSGEATVASCVVFTEGGPDNSQYRRFNIKGVEGGDDYGALEQAITRRYTRLLKEEQALPDILFIDGGKGQLNVGQQVMLSLNISEITLIGVAKGEGRKAGLETLFISGQANPIILPADSPALLLIQQIRDEAHRFAITGQRKQLQKARTESKLEAIPGLGPKRRQALLKHFGGIRGVKSASTEELAKVSGISPKLASKISDYYQSN